MDLGTGGGLPGLVLAWHHRTTAWTLVDATAKKVAAVQQFAVTLELDNVEVVHARAEGLAWAPEHRGCYDGIVARAVAPLPTLLELARGFLAPGGRLVAVKGPAWSEELTQARAALRLLAYDEPTAERLSGEERETWLVTMAAQGPPPAGFPRRDGTPQHDPLC
jgi:16S rRNA (guanine527-N7)-methyltransferase